MRILLQSGPKRFRPALASLSQRPAHPHIARRQSTQWATTLSSKVNLQNAINLRASGRGGTREKQVILSARELAVMPRGVRLALDHQMHGREREVGAEVWGVGFRVWGVGFRVWDLGFRE